MTCEAVEATLRCAAPDLTAEELRSAAVKIALLAYGLRLTDAANRALFASTKQAKRPLQTRSGVSGGLDLILPGQVFVNAPVTESFAAESVVVLTADSDGLVIQENGTPLCRAEAIPQPSYYALSTEEGRSLREIGQMCSPDRFCYGMTGPGCSFWREHLRCLYCSIGSEVNEDALRKREDELYRALDAACEERHWPARHILLGGGTPSGEDMGALLAARLCEGIKTRFDLSIYVMIVAPLKDEYIDQLAAAGADELGMNIEFWGDSAWKEFIPGKLSLVGKDRYLEALAYSVKVIGRHRTRSIIIAGLEPAEKTLDAVATLSDMGVMPIISPFRPLRGSALADRRGFDAHSYAALYVKAAAKAALNDGFLGPACVCCQNNTLALPFGDPYYRY